MQHFGIKLFFLCVVPCLGVCAAQTANVLRAVAFSQQIQNVRADREDLSRIENLSMLRRFVRAKLLVYTPPNTGSYYLALIPRSYRYLRPWAKLFLNRLSRQFHARFHSRLRVTSLVRTVAYQNALQRRNGNAAASYGVQRSSHLTGSTLDISKRRMTGAQVSWMRRVLHSLREKGVLYAIEEFQQPTFHVMVYRNYPDYVRGLRRPSTLVAADLRAPSGSD